MAAAVLTVLCILVSCAAALNLKIGVITENAQINGSLIDNAFNRRVNSNWRVLQGHTLSYVHVNMSLCSAQQAVRAVCAESGLSGLIGIGNCSLLDQLSSLSKSLQLPLIALPTGLCHSAQLLKDFVVIGSHSTNDIVTAAASAIVSDSDLKQVAIFFDRNQNSAVVENLQSTLTSAGVSSLTFQVDDTANASVTSDLVQHLQRLVKKRLFKLMLLASPRNALTVLRYASDAGVMQQNYFWLILDSGLSKADVRSVTPANANVALLRGTVSTECTAAVMDVFNQCQMDWIRSVDARFVDAVEAMAKALNDSLLDPRFSVSNATCVPLQQWTSGQTVFNRLISISNYDTTRGIVSYNNSNRHFSSQGVQVIASFNEQRLSPISFLQSAVYDPSSGILSKLFHYKGVSLAFPNTFMGFKNQTLIICTPSSPPKKTKILQKFANNTAVISGLTADILTTLAEKLEFRILTKVPDDGAFGAPKAGSAYFTGCIGELQRGTVDFGAGGFTVNTARTSVVDFSTPIYEDPSAILVPKPPPKSKVWNVFTPFHFDVWILLIGFVALCAMSTWMFAYFCPFSAYNLSLEYSCADEVWLQEYIWSALGSFLQQGQDFYPFAMSPRTVMAFWWMFTVIIYAAFTADLTAHLTVSVTDYPIKTLADLVAQNEIKPTVRDGTAAFILLTQATSGIYKQLAGKMLVIPSTSTCPTNPPVMNMACLSDYTSVQPAAEINCSMYYLANEKFNTASMAFVYPKDAYFAELFDFQIQKMQEAGLMQRLFNAYFSNEMQCGDGTSTDADAIDLEGVGGCFLVTGCLFAAGLIMLAVELFWTRIVRKQPLDCLFY